MKIAFTKPTNLDGAKLLDELKNEGIVVGDDKPYSNWPIIDADGVLWLEINEKDKTKAEAVVAAHNL